MGPRPQRLPRYCETAAATMVPKIMKMNPAVPAPIQFAEAASDTTLSFSALMILRQINTAAKISAIADCTTAINDANLMVAGGCSGASGFSDDDFTPRILQFRYASDTMI